MTLPNGLSFSRIGLGLGTFIAAANQHWGLALICLLVGAATDVLDGVIVKEFGGGTPNGPTIDMLCDLALVAGSLAGLLLTRELSWTVFAVMVAVLVVVQIINSFMTSTVLFTGFSRWFMPCYFLVVMLLLVLEYAHLALGPVAQGLFYGLVAAITLALIRLKRHRFAAWFQGDMSVTI